MCGVSTVTRCWKIEFWNISSTNKIARCTFKIIKNSLVAVLFVLTAEWLCNFNTPRSSAFYCDNSIFYNKYFSRFTITPAPLYLLLNLNTHTMCLRTEIIEPARYRVFISLQTWKDQNRLWMSRALARLERLPDGYTNESPQGESRKKSLENQTSNAFRARLVLSSL